jgi:adenylate cyclase
MGIEIERKFLLKNATWRDLPHTRIHILQGYISIAPEATVRVRIAGAKAFLTLKGKRSNYSATEFEYPIPVSDARLMLEQMCVYAAVEKWRHVVESGGYTWEIDQFCGANKGLYIAEIELESADADFPRPEWLGAEVSNDPRYSNSSLAQAPYTTWEVKHEE